ncbi:MAG: hypothetical protein M1570_08055 [Chloroflexi bacterium]|nr:hypothetical protein [Chloroflexota bacterium]
MAAGILFGIPTLIILAFIAGLYQAFESTVWTEGYLAATALPTPAVLAPAGPGL